ncbi:CIR protein PIR protein [Plasmodium vinckei lentum]|uniref:CIR protein PIR protein n=1 Tax=Plasmodium vinckei lentum TaxID=138297 RepID=A0A6V7RW31_PLAVN|nr:CIR protein PIR protein [Plasmodium vinckei lentum]
MNLTIKFKRIYFFSLPKVISHISSQLTIGYFLCTTKGSGNSLPTDNNTSSTTQIPNSDPNSPSIPQFHPPLVTSSQAPSSQKQPSSIHDSQDTVQNGASNIVQQPNPNDGKGRIKTLTITQVTLLSSGISPSNIGNGSNPSGTDVKINEKPSIWCIGSNKKCDILDLRVY